MTQKEWRESVAVFDEAGRPGNFGWARKPLFTYAPEKSWTPRRYRSARDRYIIFSPTHIFSFEAQDDGLLGFMRVTIILLRDKRQFAHSLTIPFPLGSFAMPDSSENEAVMLRFGKNVFDFIVLKNGARIIRIDIPHFSTHRSLRGEVVLSAPAGADSLITNMGWPREKLCFQYARCSPYFTVEGVMQFESADIVFTKGNGWGILDWRRAARPRQDSHFWAAACAPYKGRLLGLCAGFGTAEAGLGTENAFFVNGRLHKLDQVTFQVLPSGWMHPWHFSSNDKRLSMTFEPRQEFENQFAMLYHTSRIRQAFGVFSGHIVLDDGSTLEFNNISGLAERRKSRF